MTGTLALIGGGDFDATDAVDRQLLAHSRGDSVLVLPTADAVKEYRMEIADESKRDRNGAKQFEATLHSAHVVEHFAGVGRCACILARWRHAGLEQSELLGGGERPLNATGEDGFAP